MEPITATVENHLKAFPYIRHADQCMEADNLNQAFESIYQCLEKVPHHGPAYNYLGWLHALLDDDIQAERFFLLAIEHSPEFGASYLNYGQLLLQQERTDELLALLRRTESVPKIDKEKLASLQGQFAEFDENYDIAISFYKKAVRYATDTENVIQHKNSLARCLLKQTN